jgi:hypothetical protein
MRVSANVHGRLVSFSKIAKLARTKKTFFEMTYTPRFSAKRGGKMSVSGVSREIVIHPSKGSSPAKNAKYRGFLKIRPQSGVAWTTWRRSTVGKNRADR